MRTRSSVVAAGLLGVVLLGAGSWAWAAIPAPATGLITACYAKVGGALRVIDGATAAKCRATENKISWQQAGLRWRGVWSATVPYALNDAVSYRGGSAIATANPPVGTQPSLEAYWAKLAVPGAAAPTPAHVVWVAKHAGDYTSVKAALASIVDNDATHPYVIKIAPGIYDEPGGIDLKSSVDLEGSGTDTTTITCACGTTDDPFQSGAGASLRAAGANLVAQVRQLSVNNTGPAVISPFASSIGVWTAQIAAPNNLSFLNINVNASGSPANIGIFNEHSSPTMTNVNTTSIGTVGTETDGIVNHGGSPVITNNTITVAASNTSAAAIGVSNIQAAPVMNNVTVSVTHANQQLANDIESAGIANANSSPVMHNITVNATGRVNMYAIWNTSSDIVADGLTLTVSAGLNEYAIINVLSDVTVRNSDITALSGTAIFDDAGSKATLLSVTFHAKHVHTASTQICVGSFDALARNILNASCD